MPAAPPNGSNHISTRSSSDRDQTTFESTQDGNRIKVHIEGKFALTDDWTGIASLARGAEMRFQEDDGRVDRRLDVEPGSDGRLVYTWKIDGAKRAFDAEGQQWLRGMLLHFIRGTGYDAERRIAWFLQRQGPDGVLAEMSQLPNDYVKRIYFQKLFANRGLEAGAVTRALAQAGQEIGSDYDLARVLLAGAESQQLSEASVRAFVAATQTIGSDYDHRRALSAAVRRGDLSQETLLMVLRSAQRIGSGYDRATLLVEIAHQYTLSGAAKDAYREAARSIGSTYDRQRAERALARQR